MKKFISLMLVLLMMVSFAGCGSDTKNDAANSKDKTESVDLDLTKLSSTMVYSEVNAMMTEPGDFVGKTIKMNGQFAIYQAVDSSGKPIPDQIYFACMIADATACCQQGIEFVLAGDYKYPDDYPKLGSEITVSGEFQTYMEGPQQYCHLVDAVFE